MKKEIMKNLLNFKDDLKFFGGVVDQNISFCFNRYIIMNKRIRCPSYLAYIKNNIIENMLNNIKKISKDYFSIELNY